MAKRKKNMVKAYGSYLVKSTLAMQQLFEKEGYVYRHDAWWGPGRLTTFVPDMWEYCGKRIVTCSEFRHGVDAISGHTWLKEWLVPGSYKRVEIPVSVKTPDVIEEE